MLGRGLTSILRLYESEHPNVEIRLVELNTREQISALQRGTIDYGFLHTSMVP
jgi:DNA-binding transcriptional LysR family regulator